MKLTKRPPFVYFSLVHPVHSALLVVLTDPGAPPWATALVSIHSPLFSGGPSWCWSGKPIPVAYELHNFRSSSLLSPCLWVWSSASFPPLQELPTNGLTSPEVPSLQSPQPLSISERWRNSLSGAKRPFMPSYLAPCPTESRSSENTHGMN